MALSFDGTDDRISVGNTSATNITGTAITVAAWVYLTAEGARRGIITKTDDGSSLVSWALWIDDWYSGTFRRPLLQVSNGAYGDYAYAPSATNIALNTWTHIAATHDGANGRLYINGALDATTAGTTTMGGNTEPVYIGAANVDGSPGRFFAGRIAEVGVWNAVLPARYIEALARGISPALMYRSNLRGYYPLLDSGADWSEGRSHGTVTGAAKIAHPPGIVHPMALPALHTPAAAPPPPPPPPPADVGITYSVQMDFGRDSTYAHPQSAISSRVLDASWSLGMNEAYQEFASPSRCTLTLDNSDGAWSPDKTGATYQGLLVPGVLIRIRATHNATTYTLWQGKVSSISAAPGGMSNEAGGWRQVRITAEDAMLNLLDTEYVPRLILNARTDEAIRALFEAVGIGYPYSKDWFMLDVSELDDNYALLHDPTGYLALSQGRTTLTWVGDNLDQGRGVSAQTYIREMVSAEAGGRFFWNGRTGKFTFHDRYHDVPTAPVGTFGGAYVSGASAAFGKDVANAVTLQFEPRAMGGEASILWELETPFTLRPEQERTLTVRYRDAENRDAKVSAAAVLPLQVGDIEAYIQIQSKNKPTDPEPPLGENVTARIGYSMDAGVSSAKVTIVNTLTETIRVTMVRVRGTPLTTYARDEVFVLDADSIQAYDRRDALLSMRSVDDPEFAAGIAMLYLTRRKDASDRWERAMLRTGYLMTDAASTTVQGHIVARTVGHRVRMQETWSGHDREYIIVGEQHRVTGASASHEATWILKPASSEPWFTLDTSELNSADQLVL